MTTVKANSDESQAHFHRLECTAAIVFLVFVLGLASSGNRDKQRADRELRSGWYAIPKAPQLPINLAGFLPLQIPGESARGNPLSTASVKIHTFVDSFAKYWARMFPTLPNGETASMPEVVPYSGKFASPCGELPENNAEYCEHDAKIYYNEDFVAGLMKDTGEALHTSGDYGGIVVLAHEIGHAAVDEYRWRNHVIVGNEEEVADCFAGVITKAAAEDGLLSTGALDEAYASLYGNTEDLQWYEHGKAPSAREIIKWANTAHRDPGVRGKNFIIGYNEGFICGLHEPN